jgi:hypothetical protein
MRVKNFLSNYFDAEFFSANWEKSVCFLGGKDTRLCQAFSLAEFEAALECCGQTHDDLRVVQSGQVCHEANFIRPSLKGTELYVCKQSIIRSFRKGATIVINDLEHKIPAIATLAKHLEVIFKRTHSCVGVNAYLTPPSAQGFLPHFDSHDVIVIQISGSKIWSIWDAPFPLPLESHESDPEVFHFLRGLKSRTPLELLEFHPGSIAYIPRGVLHAARSTSSHSLHLTIGLHAPKRYDLVIAIAKNAWRKFALEYGNDRRHAKREPLGCVRRILHKEFRIAVSNPIRYLNNENKRVHREHKSGPSMACDSEQAVEFFSKFTEYAPEILAFRKSIFQSPSGLTAHREFERQFLLHSTRCAERTPKLSRKKNREYKRPSLEDIASTESQDQRHILIPAQTVSFDTFTKLGIVTMACNGFMVPIDRRFAAAIDYINRRDVFSPDELPGLLKPSWKVGFCRLLVRLGLLRVLSGSPVSF